MATATFHFLGQERDITRISVEYKKEYWDWNGIPASIPLGGMLKIEFATHPNDNIFEERITTIDYDRYKMGYPMDEGEIIFYDASGNIIKRWKYADTIIKEVKTVFRAEGETPMMTYLVLSPAIQNYGHLYLKSWNISYTEPELYKSPIVATESKTILVTKVTGSKELKLNQEGTYKVTSYNQTATEQEKQRVKWMLTADSKEILLEQKGEEIKYTPKDSKLSGKEITLIPYLKKHTENVSVKTKILKEVVVFFIGGASDKETYYGNPATKIVEEKVKKKFDAIIKKEKIEKSYTGVYLGYNEVRGDDDIENNVISEIPNKGNTAIYIIGHSLGGWNGAHLSQILTAKGYNVDLLITLDPVGVGSTVTYISDIYWTIPKPKANYWIHISTFPEDYQFDDFIADFGGQWRPKAGMQINDECSCNHGSAGYMFTKHLKDTDISASDMLLHHIKLFLSKN